MEFSEIISTTVADDDASENITYHIIAVLVMIVVAVLSIAAFIYEYLHTSRLEKVLAEATKKSSGSNNLSTNASTEKTTKTKTNESSGTPVKDGKSSKESSKSTKSTKSVKVSSKSSKKSTPSTKSSKTSSKNETSSKMPVVDKDALGISSTDFKEIVEKLAPFLVDYVEHPEQFDVGCNVTPGFIINHLSASAPEEACSFDDILDEFKKVVFPGVNHWQHPNFLGYLSSGRSYPDILAELLTSMLGVPSSDWNACPSLADLEVSMINWVGHCLALPETHLFKGNSETSKGGGYIAESTSEAAFLVVTAARTAKIDEMFHHEMLESDEHYLFSNKTRKNFEKQHEICSKLVVYVNKEVDNYVAKACQLATVRLNEIATDDTGYEMTEEQLEAAVKEDLEKGLLPTMVYVSLGSTPMASCDRLEAIGRVAEKYKLWVHVDASYTGASWIDTQFRSSQKGLNYAKTINVNLQKLLLLSSGLSAIWTSDQKSFRAISMHRSNKQKVTTYDACSWGIHDRRRLKALKIWFSFRMYGVDGLKGVHNQLVQMTSYLRSLMLSHPNISMFGEQKQTQFCIQYTEPLISDIDRNIHTERLCIFLNESRKVLVIGSRTSRDYVIRIAISYEKTCRDNINRLWEEIKKLLEYFKTNKDDFSVIKQLPSPPQTKMIDDSFDSKNQPKVSLSDLKLALANSNEKA